MQYPEVENIKNRLYKHVDEMPYLKQALDIFNPMSVTKAREILRSKNRRIIVPNASIAFVVVEVPMFVVSSSYNKLSPTGRERVVLHEFAHFYIAYRTIIEGYDFNPSMERGHGVFWKDMFKKLGNFIGFPKDEPYYKPVYHPTVEDVDYPLFQHYLANFYCPICKDVFVMRSEQFKKEHSHGETPK